MEDRITKTQSEITALKEVLSVYRRHLVDYGLCKEESFNDNAVIRDIQNIIREKVNYKRLLLMQD